MEYEIGDDPQGEPYRAEFEDADEVTRPHKARGSGSRARRLDRAMFIPEEADDG